MNPKIGKLKEERIKNTEKISKLQERNRTITEQITRLENNEIIGIVREIGMTPEQLAELLHRRHNRPQIAKQETEEELNEND